jgi:hypothetical protein
MRKLIFIPLLFLSLVSSATKYYVKNGGSDVAAGTSDGTAWETINKVNTYSVSPGFNPGDTIAFNKGDTWREYLYFKNSGTSGSPIVITSYGTGDKSEFKAFEYTGAGWTDMGSGIYRTTAFLHSIYGDLFEDDVCVDKATSTALTDGDWYSGYNYLGYTYFRPSSGVPTDHVISYTNYLPSHYKSITPAFEFNDQSYITIRGIKFHGVSYGILGLDRGTGSRHITITNCDFENCMRAIFFEPWSNDLYYPTLDSCYFYRCKNGLTAYGWSSDDIPPEEDVGKIYYLSATNNEFKDIGTSNGTTLWGETTNDQEALGFQNINNSIIEHNYMHGGTCLPFTIFDRTGCSSDSNIYRYNIMMNTDSIASGGGIQLGGSSGGVFLGRSYNFFYYNLFYNVGRTSSFTFTESTGGDGGDNYVFNNTFIKNDAYPATRPIRFLSTFGTVANYIIRNNITYGTPDYTIQIDGLITGIDIDYNNYYKVTGTHLFKYGTSSYNFVNWKALGYDAHSIITDPVFVNPTSDWNLQVTSPAIDAGIGMGINLDILGHQIDDGFTDIGSIEYGATDPPPPGLSVVVTVSAILNVRGGQAIGNVTEDNGSTITSRGVCWSTSINPTITDSKTIETGTTGAYTSTITGLARNTTYHIRAYVTNTESGTSYGSDLELTTPSYSPSTSGGKQLVSGGKRIVIK